MRHIDCQLTEPTGHTVNCPCCDQELLLLSQPETGDSTTCADCQEDLFFEPNIIDGLSIMCARPYVKYRAVRTPDGDDLMSGDANKTTKPKSKRSRK